MDECEGDRGQEDGPGLGPPGGEEPLDEVAPPDELFDDARGEGIHDQVEHGLGDAGAGHGGDAAGPEPQDDVGGEEGVEGGEDEGRGWPVGPLLGPDQFLDALYADPSGYDVGEGPVGDEDASVEDGVEGLGPGGCPGDAA